MTKNTKIILISILGFCLFSIFSIITITLIGITSFGAFTYSFFNISESIIEESDQEVLENPFALFITGEDNAKLYLEYATSEQERADGLMNRESLPEDTGMLFVFAGNVQHDFWMKNMLIPLDIVFIDEENIIVDIHTYVQPCETERCPTYPSRSEYRYAIETNAGWIPDNGIEIGDKVMFDAS